MEAGGVFLIAMHLPREINLLSDALSHFNRCWIGRAFWGKRGLRVAPPAGVAHRTDKGAPRRYANICEQEGVDAWPVTASALEAVAVLLGVTRLPSTVITRVRPSCAAMGITPRAELHGLRLILRGQTRRVWRSTVRATPLRAKHLLAFTRRWCKKGDVRKVLV